MIDEMMRAFDSPASMSALLIIALLLKYRASTPGADMGGSSTLPGASNWLVAESVSGIVWCESSTLSEFRSGWIGVRLGHQMPAPFLDSEGARAMPTPA